MIILNFRARSAKNIVARARIMRLGCIVGVSEVEPDGLFGQQVVDPVFLESVPFEEVVVELLQVPVEVVVWGKEKPKGDELVGQGIEFVRRGTTRGPAGRITR